MATTQIRPAWYTKDDDSAWDRIKEAFRRDWQQTKHDLGGKQRDLNQQVGDTISQAAGKKPIPPANVANPKSADESQDIYKETDEPAYRFGYAAYRHHGKTSEWNAELEAKLRKDWSDDSEWEARRRAIRRGWNFGLNEKSTGNR